MDNKLLIQMHERIDELEKQNAFDGRFIVIFGSNEPAERIMEYLQSKDISVNGLIDNNDKKKGTVLNGITVCKPEDLLTDVIDNALILIASKYYPEMVMQLTGMGYTEGIHIVNLLKDKEHSLPKLTEEEFEEEWNKVKEGYKVYHNLTSQRNKPDKIFVCPVGFLGDAYIGMSFLHAYINRCKTENYLLVVLNKPCFKIATLFGFEENTVLISDDMMESFVQFAVFTEMANGKILILNHRRPYTCRIGEIGNYKGITFVDHFRYTIFGLDEGTKPEIPMGIIDQEKRAEYVDRFFMDNGLQKGKTALLFPYAKTAASLPLKFWEDTVAELRSKGYSVCINSNEPSEESPVEGCRAAFIDILHIIDVVEAAGLVIGLRSGLCDVISSARAEKVIIYPDRIYGPGTFLDFFTLRDMDAYSNITEMIYKNKIINATEWLQK